MHRSMYNISILDKNYCQLSVSVLVLVVHCKDSDAFLEPTPNMNYSFPKVWFIGAQQLNKNFGDGCLL